MSTAAPVPSEASAAPGAAGTLGYAPPARQRIDSVDLLRGLVMVVMMLDHTRDFTHWATWQFQPEDLTRTTPALFFTRWITHFCAPVFFFLAGTGAYLKRMRGASDRELSHFLWTRGLWLILIELTVVRFGFMFTYDLRLLAAVQTLWALGWSMILLAALVRLRVPVVAIGAFGLVMILGHDLFDGIRAPVGQGPGTPMPSALGKLWYVLHQQGAFPIAGWPSPVFFVQYPLVPWLGVMAVGFAIGTLYERPAAERQRMLVRLGVATTALFLLLRAVNVYGDPSRWAVQKSAAMTAISFLNASKYPPSLLYLAMTLGPALVFLAWAERRQWGRLGRAFVTFGRVPFFFYIGQWYVAHLIGLALFAAAGKPLDVLFFDPINQPSKEVLAQSGFPLWVTYLAWIAGVLVLYPLCRWFAGVKARRKEWWLGYL